MFQWESNLKFTLKVSKTIFHGFLPVYRTSAEGSSKYYPAEQNASVGAGEVVDDAPLPPNHSTSAAASSICRHSRPREGSTWPAHVLLTCCGKAGGQGIIRGQTPSEISATDLRAPLLGEHISQAALSVFCILQLKTECTSIFLWEERLWARWLAWSFPLGWVHTPLPPAQVLGESASLFASVINFVLPWARSDDLNQLKIWMSAHTSPPRMVW